MGVKNPPETVPTEFTFSASPVGVIISQMEKQDSPQDSPQNTGHACEVCDKVFARPEHLRRHVSTSHSKDRKFACDTCAKEFVRRDALQRHILTHQNTEPNLIRKGGRACVNCSAAKARCSGEDPKCMRCRQRDAECIYPTSNRRATGIMRTDSGEVESPDASINQTYEQQSGDTGAQHQSGLLQQPTMDVPVQPGPHMYDMQHFDPQYWNTAAQSINWLPLDFQDYVDVSPVYENGLDPFAWANAYHVPFEHGMQLQRPTTAHTVEPPLLTPQDPSPVSLGPGPSPSDSNRTRESEVGEYYVDGEPARLPRVKRRKISSRHVNVPTTISSRRDFSLAVTWTRQSTDTDVPWTPISDDTYNAIVRTILYLSQGSEYNQPTTPSSLFSENFGADVPLKQDLEHLLGLFAKNVLPLLPIIHATRLHSLGWQLTIAAVALGSHFLEDEAARFTTSLHELMRRILYVAEEDRRWLPEHQTQVLQMKLLHCIGCLYCGDSRLDIHGIKLLNELVHSIRTSLTGTSITPSSDWHSFIETETFNRTWYGIWLLDTQQTYQRQQRHDIFLSPEMPPLPCSQRSWTALTANDWTVNHTASHPPISSVLQTMYTAKALPPNTSFCEYSRTLLTHGIFHRTWCVASYFSQPLSLWTPTASRSCDSALKTAQQMWLPANETFAKWRNSACDCLDVLHWAANATIGENKGMEHPTVLHLHIARVVLLTPYENIVSLAQHLAGEKPQSSPSKTAAEEVAKDKQAIRRWVSQDQYKARLAMIHAGVMFWHVRRFGAGGWYEADAIALSTLALWAFSAFTDTAAKANRAATNGRNQQQSTAQPSPNPNTDSNTPAPTQKPSTETRSSSEEAQFCEIILIGRPTDDELVQQFVRSGDRMKVHMNGVGDLYGPKAPEKVLAEGRKILKGLGAWGARDRWVRVLERLEEVSQARNGNGNGNEASAGRPRED